MDNESKGKTLKSLMIFGLVVAFGVAGYMLIEGWSLIDSAYMTIITLGTVGYGETNDLSNFGRMFTIFLIIGGLGSAALVLNSFAALILDNKYEPFFGGQRP